ncbi:hypothetical protein HAX54_047280, partial [Datura stramonium]|nr:hypothetical protein [Datura stramonium]
PEALYITVALLGGGLLLQARPASRRLYYKLLRQQNICKSLLDTLHYRCLTKQMPLHYKLENFTFLIVSLPVGGLLRLQLSRQMEVFYYKFASPVGGYKSLRQLKLALRLLNI